MDLNTRSRDQKQGSHGSTVGAETEVITRFSPLKSKGLWWFRITLQMDGGGREQLGSVGHIRSNHGSAACNSKQHHWAVNNCYLTVSRRAAGGDLVRLTFDIQQDGQLVCEALLHGLLQGGNLLSSVLVSADRRHSLICPSLAEVPLLQQGAVQRPAVLQYRDAVSGQTQVQQHQFCWPETRRWGMTRGEGR